MPILTKEQIGKSLVEEKIITQEQLTRALDRAEAGGKGFGDTLLELRFISKDELLSFLSKKLDIAYIDLTNYLIDPECIKLIPENIARRQKIIPLFKIENILTVAMADPLNIFTLDDLHIRSGYEVTPVIASEEDINKALDQYYTVSESIEKIIKNYETRGLGFKDIEGGEAIRLERMAEEAPVVKLVNSLLMEAINGGASDIHLEPKKKTLCVRHRIDGILHQKNLIPNTLQPPIISRIKILANLDISKKQIPQDGRFKMMSGDKEIDLRVASYPTVFGEGIVIRILYKSTILLDLKNLGFSGSVLEQFQSLLRQPYGIILVTGPTSSGKTTTLYTALNAISSAEKKIITIEDPIEYEFEDFMQGQVEVKKGMTFASALRSILRLDPDIIMVGEIRDLETAEIAVRAALTGHLILSTLHTNDAPGAITRLIDMGVAPFLVSSALIGVLAQRLVRKTCPKCKQKETLPENILEKLGVSEENSPTFYKGKGCSNCLKTGYKGRTGIYELMILNDKIRSQISPQTPTDQLKQVAIETGMQTLRQDGIHKALTGITSIEEVMRVT